MAVHNWKPIEAGIFHAMHHGWIAHIAETLNRGRLPTGYYALPEQIAGGCAPDVLTLEGPPGRPTASIGEDPVGGVALADAPPRVRLRLKAEAGAYARKAKAVVVRHVSRHQVVAIIEIVSPGNKASRSELRSFVDKASQFLRSGVHLILVDLLPPGRFDPQGIHKAVWDEFVDDDFALPEGKPLTLAAYLADECPEAFVEPFAVGDALTDMPLFLTREIYVPAPLAETYEAAFAAMPAYWREVISAGRDEV